MKQDKKYTQAFYLKRAARIEMARRHFWDYCKLMAPDFFREDREHLKEMADLMQALHEGTLKTSKGYPCRKLMINIPPRHGKTFILTLFQTWTIGRDLTQKVLAIGYNEQLSQRMAKAVRDNIEAESTDPKKIVFRDIFPDVQIKQGDRSASVWSVKGSYFTYAASSPNATLTGYGASMMVIDDLVKSAAEANNTRILDDNFQWFTGTALSRAEENARWLIVGTRWATGDLFGRLLAAEQDQWYEYLRPVIDDEGNMLCPEIMSKGTYDEKKRLTDPAIWEANYMQRPLDTFGALFNGFSIYDEVPEKISQRIAYIDLADKGKDYTCAIAAVISAKMIYVVDVIYTREGMEKTEEMVARMLEDHNIKEAWVESQAGGRGWARQVRAKIQKDCAIRTFHQRGNKESRILTNAHLVQEYTMMPERWMQRWREFATALLTYKRDGRNQHDDAVDALVGLYEKVHGDDSGKVLMVGFHDYNRNPSRFWSR